jgi:predicted transcriptional regulator
MSNKPISFRLSNDVVQYLKTWAFVADVDQKDIIEEAFKEYADKRPDIKAKVDQIISIKK